MKYSTAVSAVILITCITGCAPQPAKSPLIKLITLAPGHFHAALVQKSMYQEIDPVVNVYAPAGPDVQEHLSRIDNYNHRSADPTCWKEEVYTGTDFLIRMLKERKGSVVIMAGNNQDKTSYIQRSVAAGLNVLADKPMVIDDASFQSLAASFKDAAKKKVLLYDIMTERYEVTNQLQRELMILPEIFGILIPGSASAPAVEMKSVHFLYKKVSGKVLTRPAWFMDTRQQGEGMVDVATHLVDLVQWECFPEQTIDYRKDIQINDALHTATTLSLDQYRTITHENAFPAYLDKNVTDKDKLTTYTNGEMNYMLKGVHVKLTANWEYRAPEGCGDTHYSRIRGTKADLIIRQEAQQNYRPTLYIQPARPSDATYASRLAAAFKSVQARYPGLDLQRDGDFWRVRIPDKYYDGHEAHFAKVTEKFISYLTKGQMPAWEVPNMLAKYYTTTMALKLARQKEQTIKH